MLDRRPASVMTAAQIDLTSSSTSNSFDSVRPFTNEVHFSYITLSTLVLSGGNIVQWKSKWLTVWLGAENIWWGTISVSLHRDRWWGLAVLLQCNNHGSKKSNTVVLNGSKYSCIEPWKDTALKLITKEAPETAYYAAVVDFFHENG